jgi:hypothetical protein
VQVTSPIVSFDLCIERFNKWLGTLCMACRSYAFIQLIYSCPPRAFILFNSLETLAFRILLVCLCAHDQPWQRNAHQCFQFGGANCFQRVDAVGAHAMLESLSTLASQAASYSVASTWTRYLVLHPFSSLS